MTSIRNLLVPGLALALAIAGCSADKRQPDAGPASSSDLLPYQTLSPATAVFFTFFNNRGEMQTVEDEAEVPATARAAVKVTDPQHPLTGDYILVADLRTSPVPFLVRIETNSAWLDRMMPKVSLLEKTPGAAPAKQVAQTEAPAKVQGRLARAKRLQPVRPRENGSQPGTRLQPTVDVRPPSLAGLPSVKELAQSAKQPQIIIYSTAWCPSCRAARQYFQQRGLSFRELDVEQDQAALAQYQALEGRFRLRPGVVPVIVINGRPFQGFSKGQLEAALAGF